jgi:hypothetical protein
MAKIIKTHILTTNYKKAQKICRRSGCEDPKYKFLDNYIQMLCPFLAISLIHFWWPTKKEKKRNVEGNRLESGIQIQFRFGKSFWDSFISTKPKINKICPYAQHNLQMCPYAQLINSGTDGKFSYR